ncbi:MAG: hypothetical protein GEU80_17875 [Dehalococcoidia bacterium]|nr:hypothetical protein [Dehalococcoidia bacterium]
MRLLLVAVLAVPVIAFVVLMQDSGGSLFRDGTGASALDGGPGGGPDGDGEEESATPTSTAEEQPSATPTESPTATATRPPVESVVGSPFGGDDFVRALEAQGVEAERGSETNRCDADDDGVGVQYRLTGPGSASGTVYFWVYADAQARERHWVTGGAPTPRDPSCPHEGSYWNQNVVLQSGSVTDAGLRDALRSAILTLDE